MSKVTGLRERVAEGVQRRHTKDCGKSRGKARCSCTPTYVARLRLGDSWRERTFPSLADAVTWRQAARTGEAPKGGSAPTLADGTTAFLVRAREGRVLNRSGRPYSAATLAGYESALRVRVLPTPDRVTGLPLGDLPADRLLEPRALQRVLTAWREDGASDESVRAATAAVRAVLRWMYDAGHLDTLPPQVLLPPPAKRRERVVTDGEAQALLAAADADDARLRRSLMAPLLRLLMASGLRIGEALTLTWGAEGLEVGADEAVLHVGTSKTDAGERDVVILDRDVIRSLREHRLATGRPDEGRPVFGNPKRGGDFYTRDGAPRSAVRRVVAAAGRALLIAEGTDPDQVTDEKVEARMKGVQFHVHRHTHATHLGTDPRVDAATLAARLGHADPSFTARRYVHARDDRARELARIAAGL